MTSSRKRVLHFERLVKPQRVSAIKTSTIDAFIARRRNERGRKPGSTISPASVNKELRHLRAILTVAHDWGHLEAVPKIRMLKEPGKLIRYVTPEDFARIYEACESARLPEGRACASADWWRALLVFAYMTGWRIGEIMALKRHDLDLAAVTAITRAEDNKGGRDELIPLHPIIVEHLKRVQSFDKRVFAWDYHERTLWSEFYRIQKHAGIHLPCHDRHEHTQACHLYSFHDYRRAFATANAGRLSADALQALMRHRSYLTTQKYINMARQLDQSVEELHVPPILKRAAN